MKKLEELGISLTPWEIGRCSDGWNIVRDAKGKYAATPDGDEETEAISNARLIAAAPKLYGKAYEVAENLLVHLALPSQTISMNRAEVAAMVKDLQSALAEAAGESEVK